MSSNKGHSNKGGGAYLIKKKEKGLYKFKKVVSGYLKTTEEKTDTEDK